MTRRSHHVACITHEREKVIEFLTEVVGLVRQMELHAPPESCTAILGWPDDNPGADGTMLGEGPGGIVEVIQIPDSIADSVEPTIALASFATQDIEAQLAACAERGIETSELIETEELGMAGAVAHVGGLDFELIRFERRTD